MSFNDAMIWVVRAILAVCLVLMCLSLSAFLEQEYLLLLAVSCVMPVLVSLAVIFIVMPKVWAKGKSSDLD